MSKKYNLYLSAELLVLLSISAFCGWKNCKRILKQVIKNENFRGFIIDFSETGIFSSGEVAEIKELVEAFREEKGLPLIFIGVNEVQRALFEFSNLGDLVFPAEEELILFQKNKIIHLRTKDQGINFFIEEDIIAYIMVPEKVAEGEICNNFLKSLRQFLEENSFFNGIIFDFDKLNSIGELFRSNFREITKIFKERKDFPILAVLNCKSAVLDQLELPETNKGLNVVKPLNRFIYLKSLGVTILIRVVESNA